MSESYGNGFRPVRTKKAQVTEPDSVAQPEPEAGARVAACLAGSLEASGKSVRSGEREKRRP